MPIAVWNSNYNLGIEEIDEQHRMLVGLMNQLHDALKVGKAKNIIGAILASMEDYASFHFHTEEKYMEEFNYANSEQHRAEHEEFTMQIAGFRESFERGDLTVSIKVMRFLMDWLIKHIMRVDRQYVQILKARGL